MSLRALIDRWFVEVYEKGNRAVVYEMVAPECRVHGLPAVLRGPEGFMPFLDLLLPAFRSVSIVVEDSLEVGDRIAFRAKVTAQTHDARTLSITGGGMLRFQGSQIVEAWDQWDFLSLLTALGDLPPDGLPTAMQRLASLKK